MSYGFSERLLDGDRSTLLFAGVAVLLVVAPLVLPAYQKLLLAEVLVFAIFSTAFNLLYGYTGLLSFGHAMFLAVSGYFIANWLRTWSEALGFAAFGGVEPLVSFAVGLVLAVAVATLLATFVGYLSVQLREIYFAMITLSFSMAIYVMANNDIGGLTNGSDGMTHTLGTVNLFGLEIELINILSYTNIYLIILAVFAVSMYALYRVVRSPFGMTCKAIRENPGRAEALGIDVTHHSWLTFIISGAFSGLAGALLMVLERSIGPGIAYWSTSAEPVIMTVIGGPASFLGPAIGSFTYVYLREFITQIGLNNRWQLAFGLLLLVVVLFFENGVAGGLKTLARRYGSDEGSGTEPMANGGED
ncbi:branched-chain amino acid ABC transporter permease [Halorarum halobium]|uniref:branched-chain amino acid ABC transporter permease n=1 Tax=Halorarum halobium TaxID=3075121 RepID=UPI0028A71A39|nr:branched-chain amino acid ABC transporter permease [Halobaculum sp. XH14]